MSARTRREIVLAIAQREMREIQEEERETEEFMTFEQAREWVSNRADDPTDPLLIDPTLAPEVALELARLLVEREELLGPGDRVRYRVSGRAAPRLRFARRVADGELKRFLAWAVGYSLRGWFDERADGYLRALDSQTLRLVWRELVKQYASFEIDVMLEDHGRTDEEIRSGQPRRFRVLARTERRPRARDS